MFDWFGLKSFLFVFNYGFYKITPHLSIRLYAHFLQVFSFTFRIRLEDMPVPCGNMAPDGVSRFASLGPILKDENGTEFATVSRHVTLGMKRDRNVYVQTDVGKIEFATKINTAKHVTLQIIWNPFIFVLSCLRMSVPIHNYDIDLVQMNKGIKPSPLYYNINGHQTDAQLYTGSIADLHDNTIYNRNSIGNKGAAPIGYVCDPPCDIPDGCFLVESPRTNPFAVEGHSGGVIAFDDAKGKTYLIGIIVGGDLGVCNELDRSKVDMKNCCYTLCLSLQKGIEALERKYDRRLTLLDTKTWRFEKQIHPGIEIEFRIPVVLPESEARPIEQNNPQQKSNCIFLCLTISTLFLLNLLMFFGVL